MDIPPNNPPILPVFEPGVCNTESVGRSLSVLIQPCIREPVIQHCYIPGYLNLRWLEFNDLGSQSLTSL